MSPRPHEERATAAHRLLAKPGPATSMSALKLLEDLIDDLDRGVMPDETSLQILGGSPRLRGTRTASGAASSPPPAVRGSRTLARREQVTSTEEARPQAIPPPAQPPEHQDAALPGMSLTLRPLRYPHFYDRYRDAIKNTWTVEEVDLHTDRKDLQRLTDAEAHLVSRLVAFFATGDTIVANNLAFAFDIVATVRDEQPDLCDQEMRAQVRRLLIDGADAEAAFAEDSLRGRVSPESPESTCVPTWSTSQTGAWNDSTCPSSTVRRNPLALTEL